MHESRFFPPGMKPLAINEIDRPFIGPIEIT